MGYRIFGKAKIMTKVLIFGGTVEGRELAEYGVQKGLTVAVSVVSEYGQGMLKAREGLSVRQGVRLYHTPQHGTFSTHCSTSLARGADHSMGGILRSCCPKSFH